MNRKLLPLLFISFLLLKLSYGQVPLGATNPNFVHDKMTAFYLQSEDVKLPDSIHRILKDFAYIKGKKEISVLRNDYMFKVLLNKSITIEDRLFACSFYIKANEEPYATVPMYLLKDIQLYLIAKSKTR
jgi:hypothetical protein